MTRRNTPGRDGWGSIRSLVVAGVVCASLYGCASPPSERPSPGPVAQKADQTNEKDSATAAPSPSITKAPKAEGQAGPAEASVSSKERVPVTAAEREKLAALIRERAAARGQGGHPEDRKSTSEPPVVPGRLSRQLTAPPKPAGSAERATARDLGEVRPSPEKGVEAPPTPAASQPAAGTQSEQTPAISPLVTSQPAPDTAARGAEVSGCKGPQTDVPVPPPPDQPQPKLVIRNPRVVREHVWAGQKADFEFEIANEGEGPLEIALKRG